MKNVTTLLCTMFLGGALLLTGCKKDTDIQPAQDNTNTTTQTFDQQSLTNESTCGTATTVALIAGQYHNAGTVTVTNTANYLLVTYATTGGWYLQEAHLYAGNCNNVPRNGCNPAPGQFPYSKKFTSSGVTTYTFQIPLSSITGDCFCVAAHALLCGHGTETAWGQGVRITNNNWAMKFSACKQSCVVNEGCALDATMYPGNNDMSWPIPNITLGGYVYDQNAANGVLTNGPSNCKTLFIYTASIKLSGVNITPQAKVWPDVSAVETWLATQQKLTVTNIPDVPASVMTHVNNIIIWSQSHQCPQ